MDPTVIRDIADYYERELGYNIPDKTPFVGADFNMTRAGIHADGMMKDEEIYNIFDTGRILKSPPSVTISNTSGAAGVAVWLARYLDEEITKSDERVVKLKNWVDAQYAAGRVTIITYNEMEEAAKELGII